MTLLPIHIIAGFIGLISGAVALSARKGAKLHRKGGMIFVYAMLVVAITGTVMGAIDFRDGRGDSRCADVLSGAYFMAYSPAPCCSEISLDRS